MPKNDRDPESAPLPSTLQRSPKKAQDTYEKTLESAEKTYDGNEQAAHRAAWASVKHSFEKTGDHWEPKAERGPSDPRAEQHGPGASAQTYGGVDVEGKTKEELRAQARAVGADVSSGMTKAQLGEAIEKANRREDRKRREGR
ncbi:MAG: ChaB family protein [Candidatus Eremiobacteraeota bacterium]|nr:ChaB family protein [Candidatus Eremiobacteraeota bacterium]MBC5801956.1 ChaB family protein [Candidatus Eremiobacteraeota bacterium]MBC5821876.1 ChaB family protein [Candidatus Eremiobacteraeota bacterium]